MNLGNLMETIKDEVSVAMHEADKFSACNKAAGTRVRKSMQNIKNLAQEVRKEVQEQKNSVAV